MIVCTPRYTATECRSTPPSPSVPPRPIRSPTRATRPPTTPRTRASSSSPPRVRCSRPPPLAATPSAPTSSSSEGRAGASSACSPAGRTGEGSGKVRGRFGEAHAHPLNRFELRQRRRRGPGASHISGESCAIRLIHRYEASIDMREVEHRSGERSFSVNEPLPPALRSSETSSSAYSVLQYI